MSNWKSIISASRLRTLPLALSCIISGAGVACYFESFDLLIFVLAVLTTICLQVLANFANDLGDSEKGTDNESRIGPMRAIQSGKVSRDEMKNWIKITMYLALAFGTILILASHLLWFEKAIIFALGALSIWAAMNYTSGKAYGYRAYGDLFVFLFFGIIGVCGFQYLCIHQWISASLLPAIGVGCLSVAVLHLNNMRDFENDKASNKITLAIKLGFENSKIYFLGLISISIIAWASFVFTQNFTNLFSYIYWLGFLPLLMILVRFFKIKTHAEYDLLLKPTALTCFATSVLFFISQFI